MLSAFWNWFVIILTIASVLGCWWLLNWTKGISDREGEQSVVSQGEHEGKTLEQLWQNQRKEIFGDGFENEERFPLLIKILDAREDLSIQVHPPAEIAGELGGEPKTEMW